MKKTLLDKINIQTDIVQKIISRLNQANAFPMISDSGSDKGEYCTILPTYTIPYQPNR